MNQRERNDLDRCITGNYGENQFARESEEHEPTGIVCDERWCPICGENIYLTGNKTTNGRLIGSCGDAFTEDQWKGNEDGNED